MSFNIFGAADKNSIKVGYIDPQRGYVTGVSRLEANRYAALNPGTRFIVVNREKTRFLNINEVNALEPADLIPSNTPANENGCPGVQGLQPGEVDPNDLPAKICITGGSGIGAVGNPIFGTDGALLAVNLVHGGFGYRTPPRVKICDDTKQGSGAVMRALTGELAETEEVFDQEDDFEIYDLSGDDLPGYGDRFGPDGQNLGQWDPNLFANLSEDPVGAEIQKYQDYLKQAIDANGGEPYGGPGTISKIECWWHTRKETPEVVVFRDKTTQIKHDVAHWAWGGDVTTKSVDGKSPPAKQDNFVDLKFEVYSQGGNQADRKLQFTFTAEDGSHSFVFKAADFKDAKKKIVTKKVKKNTKYKVSGSGRYKGKGVEQGLVAGIGRKAKEIKGNKKGSVIFADFVKSGNDNDDLQVRATQGTFNATGERKTTDGHSTNDLSYIFKDSSSFKPPKKKKIKEYNIKDSFMNRFAISPVPPSDIPGSDYAGQWCTFEWEENFPYTGEYVFRGMADNISKVYLDNELIMEPKNFRGNPLPKDRKNVTIQAGIHTIKIDLFNIPIKEKPKSVSKDLTITYHGLNQGTTTTSGKNTYPIEYEYADAESFGLEVNGSRSKIEFDDDIDNGFDENGELKIESSSPGVNAKFSSDGTKLEVEGDGDVTIRYKWDDKPNVKGSVLKSIKIADETWRQDGTKGEEKRTIQVKAGSSKEVVGTGGYIVSGDKTKVEMKDGHGDDINATFSIASSTNNAKFSNDGKKLETDGPGDVTLKLEWDDNPDTAGVAVDKIEVGGVVLEQRGQKGSDTKILAVKGAPNPSISSNQSQKIETIFNTLDYINKADRKLWRTNVYGKGGFLGNYGICPFNTRESLPDNPYAGMHVIRWEHVDFPADGNYDIDIEVDDSVKLFIGNRTGAGAMAIGNGLIPIEEGGDEIIIEKEGFIGDSNKGTGKSTYTKFFKKGKYRIRAELTQKEGGVFSFDAGSGTSATSTANATFVNRGGETYLKVDGSGSVDISFRLRVDDNPRTSGIFASKIKIGKGPNDSIELKRTTTRKFNASGKSRFQGRPTYSYNTKEKEVITGTASFEAGREYLVKAVGSSSGTGSRIKNNGRTIEYDDNIGNGFDENGDLSITRIKAGQAAPVKGVNPMALAIDIRSRVEEQPRISPRSWNENPMGAALCIDAPLPPIPQEPAIEGEGRCPKNPIWTTRFPGGSESWWPVTLDARWSKFMNRFALSPLPPRREKNTDGGGGKVYGSTWDFEAPYDGFYALKGACDNWGRVLINNGDTYEYKLRGFKAVSPPIEKFFLAKGNHTITVEVENQKTLKKKTVKKKIFTTKDWIKPIKAGPPTPAELLVEYRGLSQGSTTTVAGEKKYPIEIADLGSKGRGDDAAVKDVSDKKIKFTDSTDQDDTDAEFKIVSTSPGVSAKFKGSKDSDLELVVTGSGDVTLRLEWDDDKSRNGKAVGLIEVAGEKIDQDGNKGDEEITIKVGNNDTTEVIASYIVSNDKKRIEMRDGHGDDINSTFSIKSSTVNAEFSSDGKKINYEGSGEITLKLDWDDNPNTAGVAVESIAVGGSVWYQEGQKNSVTQTIQVTSESTTVGGVESGRTIGGVTYDGPTLFNGRNKNWSDFMNNVNVSPYLPPLDVDNPDLPGDRTFTWSNVNFFENGTYEIEFQSDDNATLFIDGTEVAESKSFRGRPNYTYVNLSAGQYEVKVELNNLRFSRNAFTNNPTGFALEIQKDVVIFRESKSWLDNPVGVSAILIPPPCPKKVRGVGIVTDIIVDEPGYYPPKPPPPGSGYPVVLQLTGITPTAPGINYGPDDVVCVENADGTRICFPITPGNFGQVNAVDVGSGIIIPPVFPTITLESDTGVGFVGRPVIRPVIVPENILPPEDIIQVTDLVGLKQTGYVNGKPYYGSVFSKDGQLFAGIYETIGELIPVYATLQESIDNQVTTRPSAILRQGTDVSSNDPRLNIPGTPENLI